MNRLPLTLCLMLLLHSVFTSLPAPVNVHVESLNFHHVLCWEPGPGTPLGTHYLVYERYEDKHELVQNVTTTSAKLKLKNVYIKYFLTVKASYNYKLSPSKTVSFTPYKNTKIGPPKLTLAGCGNCIKVNISLPAAEYNIQTLYYPNFKVSWRIGGGNIMESIITDSETYTVDNLMPGTEYCIQVTMDTRQNKNIEPSDWTCAFTSILEPRKVSVALGVAAVLLIIVVSAVITFVYCLSYTGFICKLKAALPRALIMFLTQDYTLTPERTIPDLIFINSETDKQKKSSATPQPATGGANSEDEDEEQEEEEGNVYVDRDIELSSGISSCQESCEVSGSSKPVASVDSRNVSNRTDVEEEFEAKCEGAEDSLISDSNQTRDTNELEEVEVEVEEVCEISGSVNLFSVTLAALDAHEEEEEEEEEEEQGTRNFLKSDMQPLLPTDSKQTQGHIDSQTESLSDDLESAGFNETGYQGKGENSQTYNLQNCETQREDAEEEEEEDFSGYMSHT